MHRFILPFILTLLASALAQPAPAPAYCRTIVIKDSVVLVAYKPVIRLAPDCPSDGQARVRKSSTLNTRRGGAPYQPIRPLQGAWVVTPYGSTIPAVELWTLLTWRWEWWDGLHWQPSEVR